VTDPLVPAAPVAALTVGDWAAARAAWTVHEDDDLLVLDKPPGLSVTGERHADDLVTWAAAAGERLQPAHRIDKVTSGLVLFAKSAAAHGPLTQQFRDRDVDKAYLAITRSTGLPERGTIDLPLATGRKQRVRVGAPRSSIRFDEHAWRWSVPTEQISAGALDATTAFEVLWAREHRTLLAVRPWTGRRHQIRVHLAWIGHPIVGDPLFSGTDADAPPTSTRPTRTALHSWRLGFDDLRGERVALTAWPAADFWSPLLDDGAPT
jgi:tRNA pseudouridine32 synthase/23S rRNA pseudouridine746 synthase/23S rRNA pseudouridine1911/1915/1917 synthase